MGAGTRVRFQMSIVLLEEGVEEGGQICHCMGVLCAVGKTNSRDSELGGAETRDRVVKVNANCMTERRTTLTVEQYNFLDTP